MSYLKPTPPSNQCTECGYERLTIARDTTDYFRAHFEGGQWCAAEFQNTEGCDDIRLFCPECGTYFITPDISF